MIIIRANTEQEEQEIAALVEQALKGREVDVFQNENAEHTVEDIMTFLAYNTKQVRVYVGRIERNTRLIEQELRQIGRYLAPVSALATAYLIEKGDNERLLHQLERERAFQAEKEMEIRPRAEHSG
jgi:hypothetical protein